MVSFFTSEKMVAYPTDTFFKVCRTESRRQQGLEEKNVLIALPKS